MQNVENPYRASLLAGTVLRCLERLQIEAVEQFYIFNDGLSIKGGFPPLPLLAERAEISSSTSNKPGKPN